MRKSSTYICLAILLVLSTVTAAPAQTSIEKAKVARNFLKRVAPNVSSSKEKFAAIGWSKKTTLGLNTAAVVGIPGVDSLVNWSDQFTAPGFDFNGNPQSVWPYTMVGLPPESGRSVTIKAPIVPVTLDLLAPDGSVAIYHGHRLSFQANRNIVNNVVKSPIYQPWIYTSGIGQFNDQMMRAQFWNRITHGDDGPNNWHTNVSPVVKHGRRMQIPFGSWFFGVDANDVPEFALVDGNVFSSLLFPPTFPVDNTTVIGAAELAGDITTRDISTFLFNNIYLYDGTPDNCCVLGFHSYDFEPGDASNGNRERRYVMNFGSWIDDGLFAFGFEDITALSHEMSELYTDPFVNNETPWWLSVDPVLGSALCQDNLENGDVVEVLLSSSPAYSVALYNRTYHPQNVALFSWFAFESPSKARLGAYSFPDETTLTTLSPPNLPPGCGATP
jgi:hypothetical protein